MAEHLENEIVDSIRKGSFYGDIFSVLGMHEATDSSGEPVVVIRTFQPQADQISVIDLKTRNSVLMQKRTDDGFFEAVFPRKDFFDYAFLITHRNGKNYETRDTYSFLPVLGDVDLYLFNEGTHKKVYEKLGAHIINHQGCNGVCFAVWAPNAKRVSVVGNFNDWDGRRHVMRPRGQSGVFELFVPHLEKWSIYKYEIIGANGDLLPLKIDPYGQAFEMRPKTGTLVFDQNAYEWNDLQWISEGRTKANAQNKPISVYEVHLGSWRRNTLENNRWLTYREMAEELPAYLIENQFTHVEFLPLAEYPFDGSWGYQPTGLYAPTSRYGSPDDFKYLIDKLHQAGIGIIMDWVAAHFPKDAFGLAWFDGTALYEHQDPRLGEHKDWGTKIYNYGRNEVGCFLLANALFWIREYHIDALRIDAVASMLYLDYSRKEGEWLPNKYGGRENLEAIAFLRRLNEYVYGENAGAVTFAEESTAWPMVSKPTYVGGLGFGYKWNMGWMHDTLDYMRHDSVIRKYHQNELTFSFLYTFYENFILPLSHDEVVHGKGSMIDKMPGDFWQKTANLRLYYSYMFFHPGKKLLFMGNEFAVRQEWNFDDSLNWNLLKNPAHLGVLRLVKKLNSLYRSLPELYELDCEPGGFEWIDGSDTDNSVLTFMRKNKAGNCLIIACNFTPVVRNDYRIGVNESGVYEEIFNSDSSEYGGSGVLNCSPVETQEGWNFKPFSVVVRLSPLAVSVFRLQKADGIKNDV